MVNHISYCNQSHVCITTKLPGKHCHERRLNIIKKIINIHNTANSVSVVLLIKTHEDTAKVLWCTKTHCLTSQNIPKSNAIAVQAATHSLPSTFCPVVIRTTDACHFVPAVGGIETFVHHGTVDNRNLYTCCWF